VLSSMGLPMLNGFVGEFLILLGTYQVHWTWASWAAVGVILSACYLLWAYQRVFYGDTTTAQNKEMKDIDAREYWGLVAFAAVTLWMGIGSPYITRRVAAPVDTVIQQTQSHYAEEAARPSAPSPALLERPSPVLSTRKGPAVYPEIRGIAVPNGPATRGASFPEVQTTRRAVSR